jgi:soluble lytic murein transglycosylase-like protein
MARRDLLAGLAVAGVAYLVYRILTEATVSGTLTEAFSNVIDDTSNSLMPGFWKTANNASTYVPYIENVEATLGIPADLLARIAYQESHFRSDIVSGQTVSPAGAVGLMQLMPQYFPGAGQNWQSDVQTAGNLLASLYKQFGDWQLAVAAYNDGAGNIQQYLLGTHPLPSETSNYVAAVFSDVRVPGQLVSFSGFGSMNV